MVRSEFYCAALLVLAAVVEHAAKHFRHEETAHPPRTAARLLSTRRTVNAERGARHLALRPRYLPSFPR